MIAGFLSFSEPWSAIERFCLAMTQLLIGSLPLRVDCCDEWPNADDVHDPRQIVGKHAQSHFGSDVLEPFHQEVGCAQAHLDGAEGMLDGLPALP